MPELPEVETVCRGLRASVEGKTIAQVWLGRADLRFPFPERFIEVLKGREIESITRRSKYLLFRLSDGMTLIAHLGMSGCFLARDAVGERGKHDHVIFTFNDGTVLLYNDPRRFGLMDLVETNIESQHKLLLKLGPEPLSEHFTAQYLAGRLAKKHAAIKQVIMDAGVVVGVGNIYASEALFLAGIDPRAPALSVVSKAEELVGAIRKVLADAIESGGSSLRDFYNSSGEAGYFQHRFQVYGREGSNCYSCSNTISRVVQCARSSFFCSACQTIPGNAQLLKPNPRVAADLRKMKKTLQGG